MKFHIFLVLTLVSLCCATLDAVLPAKRQTVDKIIAIIYMPEGISVITQSDLRPGIDGVPRQLKDIVLSRMMLLDAKKLKMDKEGKDNDQKSEDDKYLARIQKQHNLTHEDIVKLFKDMGYSYQEGLTELRSMRIIDNVLDHRVRAKIMIDKKDIESYCAAHPIYHPAIYIISQATVPLDTRSTKEEQKERLESGIKSGEILRTAQWGEQIELKETDIAPEKAFIKEQAMGSVVTLEETPHEIKLLRVIDKKPAIPVPCEERTKEINNILGRDRFEKALEKYHADLWAQAHVRYIDNPEQQADENMPATKNATPGTQSAKSHSTVNTQAVAAPIA